MGLSKWVIAALAVLAAFSLMTPGEAWLGSERLVTIGDVVFGTEYVIQKPSATLFHTQNLAATDTEALAIAFPVDESGQTVSPSIAQTTANTAAASQSGFFKANWCYAGVNNPGGYDLTPGIDTWHPMKSSSMVGSGISWPYMNNAPLYGESTMQFKPAINTSPDTGNANLKSPIVGAGNGGLAGGNLLSGPTTPKAGNATSVISNMKARSTTPNRDYKNMTKENIKNATGLEKMYRNANLKNTVPQTHKGDVSRPAIIAPMAKPMDLIKPADKPKVLKDSLNMTRQDTHLKTMFWDL